MCGGQVRAGGHPRGYSPGICRRLVVMRVLLLAGLARGLKSFVAWQRDTVSHGVNGVGDGKSRRWILVLLLAVVRGRREHKQEGGGGGGGVVLIITRVR